MSIFQAALTARVKKLPEPFHLLFACREQYFLHAALVLLHRQPVIVQKHVGLFSVQITNENFAEQPSRVCPAIVMPYLNVMYLTNRVRGAKQKRVDGIKVETLSFRMEQKSGSHGCLLAVDKDRHIGRRSGMVTTAGMDRDLVEMSVRGVVIR